MCFTAAKCYFKEGPKIHKVNIFRRVINKVFGKTGLYYSSFQKVLSSVKNTITNFGNIENNKATIIIYNSSEGHFAIPLEGDNA